MYFIKSEHCILPGHFNTMTSDCSLLQFMWQCHKPDHRIALCWVSCAKQHYLEGTRCIVIVSSTLWHYTSQSTSTSSILCAGFRLTQRLLKSYLVSHCSWFHHVCAWHNVHLNEESAHVQSPTRIARLLHPHDVQQRPSTSFVNMAVLTSMVDGLVLVLISRTGSLLAA